MKDKYKNGACNAKDDCIRNGGQDSELRIPQSTNPSTYLESVKAHEQQKGVVKFCVVRPC